MRNTETGEFELVLGNRQLLSGFFIVVVLFGVFFTMGYIVGRNSTPSPRAVAETAAAANAAPMPDSRPQAATSVPTAAPAAAPAPSASDAGAPASSATAAAAAQAPAAQPEPATQPAREPNAAPPADTPPADQPAAAPGEPQPGQRYLQVMAVRRPDAEVVLKTLKDKGFPALLAPGPKDLVRVLVGPYQDAAAIGRTKADLENAGFQPIVQKY